MKQVVILSNHGDLHAIAAKKLLVEDFGVECDIVDFGTYPTSATATVEVTDGGETLAWRGKAALDWGDVTTVWWRRPRRPSLRNLIPDRNARAFALAECDAVISTLLLSSRARFVNDPARQTAAHHKGLQLVTARRLGLKTPRTLISNDPAAVRAFVAAEAAGCITKPLTHPVDRMLPTRDVSEHDLHALDTLSVGPMLVQQRLGFGQDIRVCIFGDVIFAAEMDVDRIDGRLDFGSVWRTTEVPSELGSALLALTRELGLVTASIDLRRTVDGNCYFLEVNPAGQFLFVERDTDQPLTESLCRLLL